MAAHLESGVVAGTRPPRRLLVVEDDPRIARLIVESLRGEGYRAESAGSGEQAEALAHGRPFDLVLLDRMLPGRSGIEVVRDWRRAGRTMPVVMLSAREGAEDRREAFEAGATAFLAKPFRLGELFLMIAALLAT